jgi:DNA replication protein DnaC
MSEPKRVTREDIEGIIRQAELFAMDPEEIQRREDARHREELRQLRERRASILDELHIPLDDDGRRRVIRGELSDTRALQAIRIALGLRRPHRFVLLTGGSDSGRSVGTGKTTAAAHALVAMGGGVYIESAELATLAGSRRWEDRERVRMAREAECLVVDEIGVEAGVAARTARDAALFDVVNRRQSKPKITVLITNLATGDVIKQLDERVRSRMRQSIAIVDCTGEDMRRRAA